jgi:hypothetical protein
MNFNKKKALPEGPVQDKKELAEMRRKALPYSRIYPELDIIETSTGVFTKTYMLKDMCFNKAKDMETMEFFLKYSKVLNNIDSDFDIQLTIFNKNEPINKATKAKYLISDNSTATELTDEYNTFMTTLLNKRAVNTIKEKYLTLSVHADMVDDVVDKFVKAEEILKRSVGDIADADIGIVSIEKRIQLLFNLYNPGSEGLFKERLAASGVNAVLEKVKNRIPLDAKQLKAEKINLSKLNVKDIIFPSLFNVCDSFIELDKQFCRSLYLSDIPSSLAENIVSDVTNINIPMVTSVHFKALDPENALKNLYADKERIKAEIIAERNNFKKKNKRKENKIYKTQTAKEEEVEVHNPMIDTIEKELLKAIENKEKMFFINMSLTHYNETLDGLENDTDIIQSLLLKILCKMDKCTYNQIDGFVTSLPLCINKLNSDRVFDSLNAAFFTPFNPQDILRKNGLCYGVNTINKDLVIINRKNSKNPSGYILGASTATTDRVVEVKREMLLNHISSKDKIVMISSNNDYDEFFRAMNGEIITDLHSNVLRTHSLYSDSEPPEVLKCKFLFSLFTSLNKGALTKDQRNIIKELLQFMMDNEFNICMQDLIDNFPGEEYQKVINLAKNLPDKYLAADNTKIEGKDFTLYKTDGSLTDLLITMDFVWNEMINSVAKREKTWIFIDDVEKLFNYLSTSVYLNQLFYRCGFFESILTLTTENIHGLINQAKFHESALSMLQNSGFIKLLGIGVLDRDILQTYLNITNIYLPFISTNKPGKGIILTPECNFAFEENFDETTSFYKLMHT